jgi:hypothetical protein
VTEIIDFHVIQAFPSRLAKAQAMSDMTRQRTILDLLEAVWNRGKSVEIDRKADIPI